MTDLDRRAKEILSEAFKILSGGGAWTKKELCDKEGTCFCLVGALIEAEWRLRYTNEDRIRAQEALEEVIGKDDLKGIGLAQWNDKQKSKAHVLEAVRNAVGVINGQV